MSFSEPPVLMVGWKCH